MKHHPQHPLDREIKQVLDGLDVPFQPDDWLLMEQKLDSLPDNLDTPTEHPVDSGVKQVLEGFNMPFKEADWQLMEEKLNNVPIDAENHPIDEIVKGALNRAEMPFKEADWLLMEEKLATPQTSTPATLRNYWQYLAAAVVLLALLYGIKDFLPSSVQNTAQIADHYTDQIDNNSTFIDNKQSDDHAISSHNQQAPTKQLQNSAVQSKQSTIAIEAEKNAVTPTAAALATTPAATNPNLELDKKANKSTTNRVALSPKLKQNHLLAKQTTKSTTKDKRNSQHQIESKTAKNQTNSNNDNNSKWAISTTPRPTTTPTPENTNVKIVDLALPVQPTTTDVKQPNRSASKQIVEERISQAKQPIISTPSPTSTVIENKPKTVVSPTSLDKPFVSNTGKTNAVQPINPNNNDVEEELAIAQNKMVDQAKAKTIANQNNAFDDDSSNTTNIVSDIAEQPIVSNLTSISSTTLALPKSKLEAGATKMSTAYPITLLEEVPLDEGTEAVVAEESKATMPPPAPEVPRNSLNDITKVGLHTSVDGNLADLYNAPNLSYTSGLSANWQVSRLWSLETGALFTSKSFTSNQYISNTRSNQDLVFADVDAYPSVITDNNNNNNNQKTMQGNWLAVEVPALVKLHLRPEKKFNWYIGTGISAYLPLKEQFTTTTNYTNVLKNSMQDDEQGSLDANPFDTERIVIINTAPSDVYTPVPTDDSSSFDPEDLESEDNSSLPPIAPEPTPDPVEDFVEDIQEYVNTNQSVGYQLQLDETYNVIGTNTINPTKPYFDILNLHLGFNYQVSKKVYIQMNTHVKTSITKHVFNRSLKGVYENQKRRLTTFGLQGGVLINL